METDVFSARVAATGTVYSGRTRFRGFNMIGTGTVVLRDGGSGGTVRCSLDGAGPAFMALPGDGILFTTDIHATVTGVTAFTAFYG